KRGHLSPRVSYSSGSSGTSGSGSGSGSVTVKVQTAVLLPSAIDSTVMSALPAATAVTNPSLSTVAIASSLLVKLTALYDALLGSIVAINVAVAPSSSDKVDLSNVTPVTGICLAVTVNAHLAVLLPSLVVTVTSALPALTAVTLPLLSTVAIAASDDANVTVLSVAVDGATVATKLPVAPSSNDKVVLSNVTPVTAIGFVLDDGTSTFSDSSFSFSNDTW